MLPDLLRPLALTTGLLLLLPPGWCCFLANLTQPPISARQSAAPKRTCCGHCGSKSEKSSRPVPDHVPGRDGKCPCGERTANAPGAPVNAGLDLSLPATVTITASVIAVTPEAACATSAAHFDQPSPHLLNCVWLC